MGKIWRWWETQGFLKNGFIVMGNRPKWKMKSVLKEVWLQWVTYPDEKTKCLKWHDRTRWGTRAEECTRKEVGLENILPERWVLKGALKKRQGLDNALPKRWGLEGTFKRGGRVRKHTT
jgi:hypothetical protein